MKKLTTLSFAFLATAMFTFSTSNAAIPIKQQAATTQQSGVSGPSAEASSVIEQQQMQAQSAVKSMHKSERSGVMPSILYIILAIVALGWLAMGINDSFGDFDWLISLVLYLLFYIPGLIYTLVKMNKYY